MTTFVERLVQAAEHKSVGTTQSEIAAALGMHRQTVNKWFAAGVPPSGETILYIAKTWEVDPHWLETGEGTMLPPPAAEGLSAEERELLRNYRTANQRTREQISRVVRTLRKSVFVIAAVLPPFLAPQHGEAATLHNIFYEQVAAKIHIAQQWLVRMLGFLTSPVRYRTLG
ncbi:MAG TPA: helix-turn-helix transcriptional regulator [Burkholderiales bacterium]|nr:helix-turn-helix transcriptional regulator [Burkholderiales bacterium]